MGGIEFTCLEFQTFGLTFGTTLELCATAQALAATTCGCPNAPTAAPASSPVAPTTAPTMPTPAPALAPTPQPFCNICGEGFVTDPSAIIGPFQCLAVEIAGQNNQLDTMECLTYSIAAQLDPGCGCAPRFPNGGPAPGALPVPAPGPAPAPPILANCDGLQVLIQFDLEEQAAVALTNLIADFSGIDPNALFPIFSSDSAVAFCISPGGMINRKLVDGDDNNRSLQGGEKYYIDLSADQGNVGSAIEKFGMGFGGTSFVGGPMGSSFEITQSMIRGNMAGMTGTTGMTGGSLVRVLFDNEGVSCAFLKYKSAGGAVRGSSGGDGGAAGTNDTGIIYNKNNNSCGGANGPWNM